MRLAALGDLHLGRTLYGLDLTPDIRRVMDRFFQFCVQRDVHVAVQLGDVFDRPTPSEAHRKIFVQWLNEFERAGIPLYVLTGNHDVMGRRGAISALESIRVSQWNYIRVVSRPLYHSGHGLLLLPFPSSALYEDDSEWLEEVMEAADRARPPTVVFSHLNIEGARLGTQEWMYRGEDHVLPPGVYRDQAGTFSHLVLAGHIHKPQRIVKDRAYVVGAAERLRFDEADEDRNWAYLGEEKLTFVKYPGLMLRTIELDASGASFGGNPPATDELKESFRHFDLAQAVVKVVPYIDDASFVNWSEIEGELYRMGARHVAMAPPVRVKLKERRKRKIKKLGHEDQAKAFLHEKVQDKSERRAIWSTYRELKERAHG